MRLKARQSSEVGPLRQGRRQKNICDYYYLFIFLISVWQHMLFEFGATSPVLLQALPRKSAGVQGQKQKGERDFAIVPGRLVLFDCYPKEKSWNHSSQEIYCQTSQRKSGF